MSEGVLLIVLLFLSWLIGFGAYIWRDHEQWKRMYEIVEYANKERHELLDRLMARDFTQLVQAEATDKYGQALQQMLQQESSQQEAIGI